MVSIRSLPFGRRPGRIAPVLPGSKHISGHLNATLGVAALFSVVRNAHHEILLMLGSTQEVTSALACRCPIRPRVEAQVSRPRACRRRAQMFGAYLSGTPTCGSGPPRRGGCDRSVWWGNHDEVVWSIENRTMAECCLPCCSFRCPEGARGGGRTSTGVQRAVINRPPQGRQTRRDRRSLGRWVSYPFYKVPKRPFKMFGAGRFSQQRTASSWRRAARSWRELMRCERRG